MLNNRALTEITYNQLLTSNSTLITSIFGSLMQDNRWLAWVKLPHQIKKSDFIALGIDSRKVLSLKPDHKFSSYDLALKALQAGTCQTVVVNAEELSDNDLIILEIAAKTSNSIVLLMKIRN